MVLGRRKILNMLVGAAQLALRYAKRRCRSGQGGGAECVIRIMTILPAILTGIAQYGLAVLKCGCIERHCYSPFRIQAIPASGCFSVDMFLYSARSFRPLLSEVQYDEIKIFSGDDKIQRAPQADNAFGKVYAQFRFDAYAGDC